MRYLGASRGDEFPLGRRQMHGVREDRARREESEVVIHRRVVFALGEKLADERYLACILGEVGLDVERGVVGLR